MNLLELNHVEKSFENLSVLKDISISIGEGEIVSIIGPSGSGKSTLLRCATMLEKMDGGEIVYLGKKAAWTDKDGHVVYADKKDMKEIRSQYGLVFQNFNLFPHYSVLKNIVDAPIHVQKRDKETVYQEARELLKKMGLADKEDYYPCQLSGGQCQRVAIARALVTEPAIICLDEPLSNLDAKLRVQLRLELKKMQKNFGITSIYVTHDQEEALTLSDRIAVFNSGVIEQVGTPNEVYNHSATEFVCNFIGDINRLGEGIVNELINMGAPADPAKHNYIRLERIHVNVQPREGEIALDGTVESLEYYGLYIKYYITVCGQTIKVIEKNDGVNIYDAGQKVKAVFNPRDIMAYEPAAEAEVK